MKDLPQFLRPEAEVLPRAKWFRKKKRLSLRSRYTAHPQNPSNFPRMYRPPNLNPVKHPCPCTEDPSQESGRAEGVRVAREGGAG